MDLQTQEAVSWEEREVEETSNEPTIFDGITYLLVTWTELFPKTEEPPPAPPKISKDEIAYFRPLIKKYGEDYKVFTFFLSTFSTH